MKNFLLLFLKKGSFLVFIILEIIAFNLIVNYNQTQKDIFVNSSNIFSGSIYKKYDNVTKYLHLDKINKELIKENTILLQQQLQYSNSKNSFHIQDSTLLDVKDSIVYKLIAAEISNKSIDFHNNYLTLDIGSNSGVKKSMGVIGYGGVVGIIRNVSPYFSQVLSILNQQFRLSVLVKNKNYLGNLRWDTKDPNIMIINGVPKHSDISIGDTIITSGYSSMFPKGIAIGTINKFWVNKKSGDNYEIFVDLFIKMNSINHCYVIDNKLLEQQKLVEKK